MQRFDPATWRHPRKQNTPRKTMLCYPVVVPHSLVDVVQENLSYASSATWNDHAPFGQPPVASTQTGQTQRVVSCGWCGRHQATRWEERWNSVREHHLTYDPIGLERRLTYVGVPIAIGVGGCQVAEWVLVTGKPSIELIAVANLKVRPIVGQVSSRMAVRRDNDVTLHDMLRTVQFDYLTRFRLGRPSGVRAVTRAFHYRKETGGAEQVADRYSHASPHEGYDLASPETNQPPSVAVSKM